MFCGKCGAPNDDNAVNCANCGEPLKEEQPQAPSANSTTIGGITIPLGRNQLIGIAGIAVAVILVIVLIASFAGGGGAGGVAEKAIKSIFTGDGKTIVNLMHPDFVEELTERSDMDKDEYIDGMNEALEEMLDMINDEFDRWSVKTEVTKTKDLKKGDIKDLEEKYENIYDVELDIEEAQEVTVKMTVKADGDEDSKRAKLTAIKVDGKWYLDYISFASAGLF